MQRIFTTPGLLASAALAIGLTPALAHASGEFTYPAGGQLGVASGTYIEIDGGGDCRAARAGSVEYVGSDDGQNYTAILQHEAGYESFYEQLEFDTLACNQGDQLNAGDEVGQSNATGFEIHLYGAPQLVPGNVGDTVNQGDPIPQTYAGLGGGTPLPTFTQIVCNAHSAWMGALEPVTINADGSWSTVRRPPPATPGHPAPMWIRLVRGNCTSDELNALDDGIATAQNDGASLDGQLPGIVADGTIFDMTITMSDGSTHELKGFFGAANRWGWDAGVAELANTVAKVFNEARATK